jgi:hypothetical protein
MKLVEVDNRGRVSLRRFLAADQHYKFYFVEVHDDGSITLTPAEAVPARLVEGA